MRFHNMLANILDITNSLWILYTKKQNLRSLGFFISLACNMFTVCTGIEKGVLHNFRKEDQEIHTQEEVFAVFEYTNLSFTHAESPVWDQQTSTLYWVDVLNREVHALDYKTLDHRIKRIDYDEVNVVIPIRNSNLLVVGSGANVYVMDWNKTGEAAFKLIANLGQNQDNKVVFNEGKVDAFGRLWGGTKGPQRGDEVIPNRGALFSIEWPSFEPKVQLSPVTLSNGLTWALNNSVLYYIDSTTNKIDAFDFDLLTGEISNRRVLVDLSEWGLGDLVPDGMTIDRDGCLWVALFLDGSVIRVNPDSRQILRMYQLPVKRVTSMTWAGDNLEDLVVTTSRRNVEDDIVAASPLTGSIFILHDLGTGGVGEHKFVYQDP